MFSLVLVFLSILPINPGKIYITSDFGEARPLRFHMGLDFSTHGRIGLPVYAVKSGVIVRVKRSYYGYGNAVYLMTPDSFIYVYAHLDRFIAPLEDTVFKLQMASHRYKQDIYFEDTLLHVKKGEVIGYSGESGVGYPHLHFEKRIGWLMPVFPLEDTIPLYPVLKGVLMETPDANYEIRDIRFHQVMLPYATKFKLFLLVSHVKRIRITHGKDTVFAFRIDTLNYLTQKKESGLLFKPKKGSFKGFIRTNYKDIMPSFVEKSISEYRLDKPGEIKVILESFYGDTSIYSLVFLSDYEGSGLFYRTYEGIPYAFSDYGIRVNDSAKRVGYKFVRFGDDTLIIIGNERIHAEIRPKNFPYLDGIFYRTNGDSLFVYPELPQVTGYVRLESEDTTKQVYRVIGRGKRYVTRTLKLGLFVLEKDTVRPYVRFVGKNDSIAFYVTDGLSGINANTLTLRVDGQWYPVYYDFERRIASCRYKFDKGSYIVEFKVYDRAHNVAVWKGKVDLK